MRKNQTIAHIITSHEEGKIEDEPFSKQALTQIQATLRRAALVTVSEWPAGELVSPQLFDVVSAIYAPSFGSWNRVLLSLRAAKKEVIRTGGESVLDLLATKTRLNGILALLEEKPHGEPNEALLAGSHEAGKRLKERLVWRDLFELAICIRNRIAHDQPDTEAWWRAISAALETILRTIDKEPRWDELLRPSEEQSPFVVSRGGVTFDFNGVDRDWKARYVAVGESGFSDEDLGASVCMRFGAFVGKEKERAENLRKLLAKLAPEEIKGVLIDDYLVGPIVGRGGFATVHKGRRISTGRQVAVKILRDGMTEDERLRFEREAKHLENLHHPNIIGAYDHGHAPWISPRVYSLSDEDWYQEVFAKGARTKSYVVLEWVGGKTLKQLRRDGELKELSEKHLLRWFAEAADALAEVHQKDLIHRDVKPSNLMLNGDISTGTIKLMDFGIAKSVSQDATKYTKTGMALGTVAYMSPEQIRSKDAEAEVGPASDIYSLCATFYEILSGRDLYDHGKVNNDQTLVTTKLTTDRPLLPHKSDRRLSPETRKLLLGGLSKSIRDRPETMARLAVDLRAVIDNKPIVYRPPSMARRAQLWYRRNRVVATISSLFFVALLTTSTVYYRNIVNEIEETERQRAKASEEMQKAIAAETSGLVSRAKNSDKFEEKAALLWTAARPQAKEDGEQKATVLGFIGFGQSDYRMTLPHKAAIWAIAYSPDGKIIATGSDDNTAKLWNVHTGELLNNLDEHIYRVTTLAFSPDGKILATGSKDHTVKLWDVRTGERLNNLDKHDGEVHTLAFSSDGKALATGSSDNTAKLWNVQTGALLHNIDKHTGEVYTLAFSPNGKLLATGSWDSTVKLWDVHTGEPLKNLDTHNHWVTILAFSPNGKLLATGSRDHTVKLWDVHTGELLKNFDKHTGEVYTLAFSPNGNLLATGSTDGTAKLWGVHTGELLKNIEDVQTVGLVIQPAEDEQMGTLLKNLDKHTNSVNILAFSPDGKVLATGSHDNTAKLWDVHTGELLKNLDKHTDSVNNLVFSPNGKILATGSWDNTAKLWDVHTRESLKNLNKHTEYVNGLAFSPDGKVLATGSSDNTAKLWDVHTGEPLKNLDAHNEYVNTLAFSPDGKLLATGSSDNTARLWDVHTGDPLENLLKHADSVNTLAFSPDGKLLATGSSDNTARLWDVHTGIPLNNPYKHEKSIVALAFSPNGKMLATSSIYDAKAKLWDIHTGEQHKNLDEHILWVSTLAFSPDGNVLATGSADTTAKLWDVHTGKRLENLDKHTGHVNILAFSPDGTVLATGSDDKTAKLWDVRTGKLLKNLDAHTDRVTTLAFAPDGKLLATGSDDNTAKLWDVHTGILLKNFATHKNSVNIVAFSPDGKQLATGSSDNTAALWPIPEKFPSVRQVWTQFVENSNLRVCRGTYETVHVNPFPGVPENYDEVWAPQKLCGQDEKEKNTTQNSAAIVER